MPATKKTARKATVRPAKTLSAAHKRALAEGRTMSAAVDRYLSAVNTPKRRGRKVSKAALVQRHADATAKAKTATGVDRVLIAQELRDLETRIANVEATNSSDIKGLESAFVKIAKRFGENRGISYSAWRDAGVPAVVLKKAGVPRTRG
jgi:hypothetical protein